MLRTVEPQNGAKNKNAEAHFRNPCSYKMKSVYKQSRKTMVEPIIFVRSPAKFFLGLNKSIVTLIIGKKVEVSLRLFDIFERNGVFICEGVFEYFSSFSSLSSIYFFLISNMINE